MSPSPILTKQDSHRACRRVRSKEADQDALDFDSPIVLTSSREVDTPFDAHETASSIELARHALEEWPSSVEAPRAPAESRVTDKYAFAFDIDGVLIRGGKPLREGAEALNALNGNNPYGIKVPYIFVTNGGGKSERERCIQLGQQLDLDVSPGQFICGHTPMREMAGMYKTVLVVGGEGEKCRQVAEDYGFQDVVTPGDVIKDNPHTTPFRNLNSDELQRSRTRNYGEVKIEAIFVFADSRDWAGDQQIIIDYLTSKGGYLGTRSETYEEGPPIYFSHSDVIWSAQHDHTRLGMGALRLSVEAMFKAVTGKDLKTTAFGKPQVGTYEFATRLLQQWRKDNYGIDAPPETVYFVGDTPESDIRGTNEFDEVATNHWYSILVETGVYQAGTKPRFKPGAICNDVYEAVRHAMRLERQKELERQSDGVLKFDDVFLEDNADGPLSKAPGVHASEGEV